jgi:glycerol-3-phosphate acyltransferase PlsX
MRIAVDAMGGDKGPGVVVEGALLAATELAVEIVLVGPKEVVENELARYPSHPSVEVMPASQIVAMSESPSATLKKKDSSMMVAFGLVREANAHAVVSAGNSGAVMATGMFVLGNLSGVERPAILCVIPTLSRGTVIIDAGANVDCKPRQLFQFGLMGSIYAERVLGILRPRLGVLSNGEEDSKGNELTRSASDLLRAAPVNYIGYVEGRDVAGGNVDVIVCDGFTGNVVLKTMEGTASFVMGVLKNAFRASLTSRFGYLMSRRSLAEARARLDYAEYGGAPLMGLGGVAIIAHGGSSPKAIKNAIRVAKEAALHDVNRHITEMLESLGEMQPGRPLRHKTRTEVDGDERPASTGSERAGKSGRPS